MKINLKEYCDESRAGMETPFSRGEFSYATDGKFIIRIPRQPGIPEREDAPTMDDEMTKLWDIPATFRPAPAYAVTTADCTACEGIGKRLPCPECEGGGSVTFSNDHNSYEIECETCQGEATVGDDDGDICPDCGGKGNFVKIQAIPHGRTLLNVQLMEKLKGLPGVKYGIYDNPDIDTRCPHRFTFSGGDGLIMPCWE